MMLSRLLGLSVSDSLAFSLLGAAALSMRPAVVA